MKLIRTPKDHIYTKIKLFSRLYSSIITHCIKDLIFTYCISNFFCFLIVKFQAICSSIFYIHMHVTILFYIFFFICLWAKKYFLPKQTASNANNNRIKKHREEHAFTLSKQHRINTQGERDREREKKKKDSKKLIKVPTIPEEAIKMENKSSYLGEDNSNQKQNKSMK